METTHWEKWIIEEHNFYTVFNTAYLLHQLCLLLYIVYLKKGKQTIFKTTTHFVIRSTFAEFQTYTTIVPQGNFISDCDIKQHIAMKT
jgi:hypothetical protein